MNRIGAYGRVARALPLLICIGLAACGAERGDTVPISTASEEALAHYLEGRDLGEKLRSTDAHRFFEQAVASIGMNEQMFVAVSRQDAARHQLLSSVSEGGAAARLLALVLTFSGPASASTASTTPPPTRHA